MSSPLSRQLVVTVAIALTGCATVPAVVAPKPDEGAVLVEVIGVQSLSVFNSKWTTLKVTNKSTGTTTGLADQAPAGAVHSLFLTSLPSGQYEITEFSSAGPIATVPGVIGLLPALAFSAMTSDSQSTAKRLGTFTVAPGRLSNLGVVVSALPEKPGGEAIVAILADPKGQSAAADLLSPVQKASFATLQPSPGWDAAPDPNANAKALEIVRRHSQTLSTLEVAETNKIVIGSVLGMVHMKAANAAWVSTSIGSLDTVTFVKPLDDGTVVAASDSGKLFVQQPDRQTWVASSLPLPQFKVRQIEPLGKHGYAVVAASLEQFSLRTIVYYTPTLTEPNSFAEWLNFDSMSALGKVPVFYDGSDLLVYFNHPGFARTADLHRVNVASRAKSVAKVDYWVSDIYKLPSGLLVMDRMNGIDMYNSFSSDNGKTWRHQDTAAPHSSRYVDASTGYGFTTQSRGWSTITVAMNKTTNGGQSWSPVGTPIESVGLVPVRVVDKTVFVFTGLQLLSTSDQGASWRPEWPVK